MKSVFDLPQNKIETSQRDFYFNPSRPNPGQSKKTKLNVYFHTSLWCLIKPFEAPQGSVKIKI